MTTPAMPELPDGATVLPDGSAFAIASFPLPSDHWLYAPREYRDGEEEPIELPPPILSHQAHGDVVRAAIRYAVRSATMCGKEPDFDPDALVKNAMYALCGPFGGAPLQAQPAEVSDAELLDAYNSIDPCNESPQDRLIRRLRAILALRPAPGVPEGFALVPVEPTEEMTTAVEHAMWDKPSVKGADVWSAVLAAAQAKGEGHA